MDIKAEFNLTPLLSEIFTIKAMVKTMYDHTFNNLSEEKKKEYKKSFIQNFKNIIKEFVNTYPDIIEGREELLKRLEE